MASAKFPEYTDPTAGEDNGCNGDCGTTPCEGGECVDDNEDDDPICYTDDLCCYYQDCCDMDVCEDDDGDDICYTDDLCCWY